jgi:hypothetical protein
VFGQNTFDDLNGMDLSCIQFGYWMMGSTPTSLSVYIDTDGGAPNAANLELLYTFPLTTVNAVGQMQVQTVTANESIAVQFSSSEQTLVVVLSVPLMSEGLMQGGGQFNEEVVGTSGETYVGGDCLPDFVPYSDFASGEGASTYDASTQWYVRLHATASASKNSNDDDNSLSTGAVVGISVAAAVIGLVVIAGIVFCLFFKSAKGETSTPLVAEHPSA